MHYSSLVDCVGNTPLVTLSKLFQADGLHVSAKLEMLNPAEASRIAPPDS